MMKSPGVLLLILTSTACVKESHDSRSPGALTITSPVGIAHTDVGWITVEGRVTGRIDATTQIDIDGNRVSLGSDGLFSVSTMLVPGGNSIPVRLLRAGVESSRRDVKADWTPSGEGATFVDSSAGGAVDVERPGSSLAGDRLEIPAGALAKSAWIWFDDDGADAPDLDFETVPVGGTATLSPIGTSLTIQGTLTLALDPSLFPAGTTTSDVRVLAARDAGWVALPIESVDATRVVVLLSALDFSHIVPVVRLPLGQGDLRVTSDPPGATIYLDARDTQLRTPTRLTGLSGDPHEIKLYVEGYDERFVEGIDTSLGAEAVVTLPQPVAPIPQIGLDSSLVDGMTVTSSLLSVLGSAQFDDGVPAGGHVVIALNGEDSITLLQDDGTFLDFVSLFPGDNTLQVRVNGSSGTTGVSERIHVNFDDGSVGILSGTGSNHAIKVVLSWNTDATDVDLHVFDPDGNHAWYGDLGGIPGANLDHDDVDGFGPEIFTMPDPRPGTYEINVDYYSKHGNGPSTATLNVFLGDELKFSASYLLTSDDGNQTGGHDDGADPAAFWNAYDLDVLSLRIVSVESGSPHVPGSPERIFTTDPSERALTIKVDAPDDVDDSQIHYDIREVVEDFTPDDVDSLTGRSVVFEASHRPLLGKTNPPKSHLLEYEIVAYVDDGAGGRSNESDPFRIVQDVRSQIRQEYVDKRDLLGSAFTLPTPSRAEVLEPQDLPPPPGGVLYFPWSNFAQGSDFSPGHAVVNESQSIAYRLRAAWNGPVNMTSGWRNPRHNDAVGGVVNSAHQTGDAGDFNPTLDPSGWPADLEDLDGDGDVDFQDAQKGLLKVAHATFDSADYYVDLHDFGSGLHVHINLRQ